MKYKKQWMFGIISGLVLVSGNVAGWSVGSDEDGNTLALTKEETRSVDSGKLEGAGVFEKKVSSLTSEERVRVDFHAALHFVDKGAELQAEEKFLGVLKHSPNHLKARSELAQLYLKHNRDKEAEMVLTEGFKQSENYPDFLKLQAMIYDRRQEPGQALSLLSRLPAGMQNESSIVSLYGHLYQQAGQYSLAKEQYKRLLETDPNNVTWLLGYTIATDSEGHKAAAIEGYKRLHGVQNLNPEILQYVGDRLKSLQG